MESNPELRLEDARSIREGLWRIAQLAQDAAEMLDSRIENEALEGRVEAVEVREALPRSAAPSAWPQQQPLAQSVRSLKAVLERIVVGVAQRCVGFTFWG